MSYFHVACLSLLSFPGRDDTACPVRDFVSLSITSRLANSSSYLNKQEKGRNEDFPIINSRRCSDLFQLDH